MRLFERSRYPSLVPFTLTELQEIINAGHFDKLIGEFEGQYLDVKGQPYQFADGTDARRELAKDVAAFANSAGGFVLIGLATKTSDVVPSEQISTIRALSTNLFRPDQYRKVLAEWLYPQPKNLSVTFVQHGNDAERGVGVIFVPPQDPTAKPFLITRTIGDKKSTDVVFGYVERRIDATDVRTVVELHHFLRIGINLERELLGRIQNLESMITSHFDLGSKVKTAKGRTTTLTVRMARTLDHLLQDSKRALVIGATALEDVELRSIFSDQPISIRRRLEAPPSLRARGWGLSTGATAVFIEGVHLRVQSHREVVDLYRDGCLTVAGSISREFLAWSHQEGTRLHPLALIEVLSNFTTFFEFVLNDMRTKPKRVLFAIQLNHLHLNDQRVCLPSGPVGDLFAQSTALDAPLDSVSLQLEVDIDAYKPERVAYEIAREVYVWFGHSEEHIPYAMGSGDERRIDFAQIVRIG